MDEIVKGDIFLFNFRKKNKKDFKEVEEQYIKLLRENGYDADNKEGFILGEKKDIYDNDVSLEDIINNHS